MYRDFIYKFRTPYKDSFILVKKIITHLHLYSYEEVLHPLGFRATAIVDNELAIEPRKVCEDP